MTRPLPPTSPVMSGPYRVPLAYTDLLRLARSTLVAHAKDPDTHRKARLQATTTAWLKTTADAITTEITAYIAARTPSFAETTTAAALAHIRDDAQALWTTTNGHDADDLMLALTALIATISTQM